MPQMQTYKAAYCIESPEARGMMALLGLAIIKSGFNKLGMPHLTEC